MELITKRSLPPLPITIRLPEVLNWTDRLGIAGLTRAFLLRGVEWTVGQELRIP